MQGEQDAKEKLGEVYEESLIGLYNQLSNDLERKDINFIILRLNDFDMSNIRFPHWTMIRDIQVKVANSNPHFHWIDTDDLNNKVNIIGQNINNNLDMTERGYEIMGNRLAEKSIQIIKNTKYNHNYNVV